MFIGATMNDPESLSQLLQVCSRKAEDFVQLLDRKHMVWLMEIEEAAKKMFNSDFTAEPELMPKTPSQKRRRKKRTSILPDENRDPSRCRISRRRSSVTWSSSVRKLSSRHVTKPLNTSIQEEVEQQPTRVTRAKAQASMRVSIAEKTLEELSLNKPNDCVPPVKISAEVPFSDPEKKPALDTVVLTSTAPSIPSAPPAVTADNPSAAVTPEKNGRTAGKLKIASSSTPKQQAVIGSIDLTLESPQPVAKELELSNHSVTPTGSKRDRRSVRRSIVGRKSTSCRTSLANQYSLASKRESMTRDAVHKSIRRSVSRKRGSGVSSSSSYKSYHSSIEEATVKIGPETIEPIEESPASTRSVQARAVNKIAVTNQPNSEPQRMVTRQSLTLRTETCPDVEDQIIRRASYKRAVDDLSDDDRSSDEQVNSPPRKKTPSPPCPPSKVVKPLPHMKAFLHTVQKNQLLMTPGSIGKSFIAKSFIKRNTPLKVDPKEKERQRQETLRKKEEAELQRKQKMEEGKKRKQEELKLRREERQRKVLQARERVEQLEEEKKKKIEQKFAQIDEKVREDRVAEEKAKKKTTAKKQEEAESKRRQEEEVRKLKAKEEEERKKREEEEQERQRKLAEVKRMADLERERLLAAEKEQERLRAEKEREKNKALQLQKELEQEAQEREQRREAEERRRKEQQERLEQEYQERLRKEMEAKKVKELEAQKLREEQERIAKEKQTAVGATIMNQTVDIPNSPVCESYEMTPKSYKLPSVKSNTEDYGMDLNSDDSTDDESKPRKPIPAWASGNQLGQAMCNQYYHPIDVDKYYGIIHSPKLEDMFYKSKPRYFKRTSSAVWHSPPISSNKHLTVGYGLKKY
ncbi:inner centromere protein isoform X2 [Eleutherodactylus coqui]|uniref:inner centromere protein isoform X2 n=1 Tax=Eleutherodactylus coqui TaxID=57060 RepID=UPI00346261FF